MMGAKFSRIGVFLLIAVLSAAFGGCAGRVQIEPINPYVDPGIRNFDIRSVAVVPFVVPKYIGRAEGGHMVSAGLTNELLKELHGLRLYHITNLDEVKVAMASEVGPLSDWAFAGTREDAIRIARLLGSDGVLFPIVHIYRQGNLIDSEVEIELALIDVFTATTIWSIRDNVRGKSGRQSLNQPVRTPAAGDLARVAIKNATKKIKGVTEKGSDFEVSTTTPRQIAGYSVIGLGAAAAVATGYYYFQADSAYKEYGEADSNKALRDLEQQVNTYDTMWMVFGGVSLASFGVGAYLLLSEDAYHPATHGALVDRMPFDVVPAVRRDGSRFLYFRMRF